MFECLKAWCEFALRHPHELEWTVQGFGMMRSYPDAARRFRLNVWHRDLAYVGVSTIHDHPWDLRSYIIAGAMYNLRYNIGFGTPAQWTVIEPGPTGGIRGKVQHTRLDAKPIETYFSGDTYTQFANEVHCSMPIDGTTTFNDRTNRGEDRARVFWWAGDWTDAKPRLATAAEITKYTAIALEKF